MIKHRAVVTRIEVTAAHPFFAFAPGIRKMIYTTNAVEALNRSLRKIIKTRGSFPNDDAALKLLISPSKMPACDGGEGLNGPLWDNLLFSSAIGFQGQRADPGNRQLQPSQRPLTQKNWHSRCRPKARQMRCTDETDSPQALAMSRELQCVASFGTLSRVLTAPDHQVSKVSIAALPSPTPLPTSGKTWHSNANL